MDESHNSQNRFNASNSNSEMYNINDKFLQQLEQENKQLELELNQLLQSQNANSQAVDKRSAQQFTSAMNLPLQQQQDMSSSVQSSLQNASDIRQIDKQNKSISLKPQKQFKQTPLKMNELSGIEAEYVRIDKNDKNQNEKNVEQANSSQLTNLSNTKIKQIGDSSRLKHRPIAQPIMKIQPTSNKSVEQQQQKNQNNNFSNSSSKKQLFNSNSGKIENDNNSQQHQLQLSKKENDQNKIHSLEMRLAGANKATKHIERQLQQKEELIQELQALLKKKEATNETLLKQQEQMVESQRIQKHASQDYKQLNESRRNEQAYEKKLSDMELIVQDQKKQIKRQQELNSQMMDRNRQLETANDQLQRNNAASQSELSQQINLLKSQLEQRNSSVSKLQNCNTTVWRQCDVVTASFAQCHERTLQAQRTLSRLFDSFHHFQIQRSQAKTHVTAGGGGGEGEQLQLGSEETQQFQLQNQY